MTDFDATLLDTEEPFVTGAARYLDAHPEIREPQPRIYVRFRPAATKATFLALLDTGAHFCILNEEVVRHIRDQLVDHLGPVHLRTAQGPVRGELYLLRIELVADAGRSLDVDVVACVPPGWQAPCFIGYSGVLDRVRFAVNPSSNRLYFGLASSQVDR